jgi:hypothetical protein
MYLISSSDGKSYSNSLTVIVSSGDQIWKVMLNGMVRANYWSNVGVRWSNAKGMDGIQYGLQVISFSIYSKVHR